MLLFVLMIILIIYSIINNQTFFVNNIVETLNIWLWHVYPSIFVFYILADILLQSRVLEKISFILKPFFHFQSSRAYALLIVAFLIGNPGSSALINQNFNNNLITSKDADKLLRLSFFMNPLFLLSFFKAKYVILIIGAQIFICFILNFFIKTSKTQQYDNMKSTLTYQNFMSTISKVIEMLLMVASIMVIANIIKFSIKTLFSTINIETNYITIFLSFIEISAGLNDLKTIMITNFLYFGLVSFLVTSQGLAITLQTYHTIDKNKFSFKKILITKIIASLLVSILVMTTISIFDI